MSIFCEAGTTVLGFEPVALVITLLVVGMVFLGVEILILPGFGVAGVLGILLLIGGITAAWLTLGTAWGVITIVATVALWTGLVVIAFRTKAIRGRLVLDTQLERGKGTAAEELTDIIGKSGEAKTDLHPSGIALVDGQRIDVVSDGGYVERGQKIKVVDVDGPRVVVVPSK